MLSVTEALNLVLKNCPRPSGETVSLDKADGRVLARPVRADRDSPPADRSAMDGYAVRAADLASIPCDLKLVGEVAAGSATRPRVRPGTCVRILTGANVPPGADSVVMVETASEQADGIVRFSVSPQLGQHILHRGENGKNRDVLLPRGIRLGPQQIAVCAAVGADPINVYALPKVGILCTGRELVDASAHAAVHEQRNSNGPALRSAIRETGCGRCGTSRVVDDDPVKLRRQVRAALQNSDVLLLVGGVSVGKYDYVPRVLEEVGVRTVFHRIRMKPGKPILFGRGPEKQLVFGLPGNPLSALTGFHEFVAPALRKMSGMDEPYLLKMSVRLLQPATRTTPDRIRLYPVKLAFGANGKLPGAVPVETHSSADVVAGGLCDGVVLLPRKKTYNAGSILEFHPWGPVHV